MGKAILVYFDTAYPPSMLWPFVLSIYLASKSPTKVVFYAWTLLDSTKSTKWVEASFV